MSSLIICWYVLFKICDSSLSCKSTIFSPNTLKTLIQSSGLSINTFSNWAIGTTTKIAFSIISENAG